MSGSGGVGRRGVVGALSLLVPAAAAGKAAAQPADAAPSAAAPAGAGAQPGAVPIITSPADEPAASRPAYTFLNAAEVRCLDALVARIVPADDLGPGAKEAGVTLFIDRQLGGAWGNGANLYTKGPFKPGTPQQGYQLSFTPAQMFRAALPLVDQRAAAEQGGKLFADCDEHTQDLMITAMQEGRFDLAPVPSVAFFAALLDATMEGFLSDPIYGGNQGMVGWKLVGFPGAYDSYATDIERWDRPWSRAPMSIAMGGHEDHMAGMAGAAGDAKR